MPEGSSVTIPGWVWKAVQGLLVAAVVGGYGLFYSMHSDIAELKLRVVSLEEDVTSLEVKVQGNNNTSGSIKESLASIRAELPFIKQGINDLKSLLR
jgi:hypothetical protein